MNTDVLVSKALDGAASIGATTSKLYLNDLTIMPCQACADPPRGTYCVYRDGMDIVYDVLERSDGLVIGTPAYYGSISSQLKLVIDRSNCLTEMAISGEGRVSFQPKLRRKAKGVFIWVADLSSDPRSAFGEVRLWCRDANIELLDSLIVTGSDRGIPARERVELLEKAFALGVNLARSLGDKNP